MASYAARKRAARDAEIIKLVKLGRMTNQQIAYRMDVSVHTVERVKQAHGLSHKFHQVTDEEKTRILALLADGASYAEVDKTLVVPSGTARRVAPGMGWNQEDHIIHQNDTGTRIRPKLAHRRDDAPGPDVVDGPAQ